MAWRYVGAAMALAACGRIHFREVSPGGGGDDDGGGPLADAAPSTGPTGPRYLIELDANGATPEIAGSRGAVAVGERFQGATTIAGHAFTGAAMYQSGALLWLDPTGAPASSSVLDSTSVCELRALGNLPATGGVIGVGYSQAGATTPADGPCALTTAHQDAIAIAIDPGGAQTLAGRFVSKTFNSQGWYATGFDDGTVAFSGIYGDNGTLQGVQLPAAGIDENPFFARIDLASGAARWIATVFSVDDIYAGPTDALGDDLCMTGAFVNTVTVLGTTLTSLGMADDWVARVDATGAPRFVRAFGSTGLESTGSGISVVATSDGGCTVAADAPGTVAIDNLTLPATAGSSIILRFDATGKAIAGARAPSGLAIGRLGDRIYGAVPCTAACTIAGASYAPIGSDIALVSFDATATATVIGSLAGGAVTLDRFAAIPPDALAVSFASGPQATTFGPLMLAPSSTAVSALAVLGVVP